MLCYTCYDKRFVVEKVTGRPLPCPECQGLALSCCEGTSRELDHQEVEAKVLPSAEGGRAFETRINFWEIFQLPVRPVKVSPYVIGKPLNALQCNYA